MSEVGPDRSQPRRRLPPGYNAHHVLYEGRDFRSRPDTEELRNHAVFIIPMDIYDHGSNVKEGKKDSIHHDRSLRPISRNEHGQVSLPSSDFVRKVLFLCDLHEPLEMSHVERLHNVRDELDRIVFDESTDSETRKDAWKYACHITKQLAYMKRHPLDDQEYRNWRYEPPRS